MCPPSFSSLDFGEAEASISDRRNLESYAGFIGSSMIMFGFLSLLWGGLAPTTDKTAMFVLMIEYAGGLSISVAFGFTMKKRVSMTRELAAVMLGIVAGTVMLASEIAIFQFSPWRPYAATDTESLWVVMLAPSAETLVFTVAIYQWFKWAQPEVSWWFIAIASDVTFALFHYYRYGLHADFFVILAMLMISNTILTYTYHFTRNATAPIVAHTIVNFATAPQAVIAALEPFFYLFITTFVVVFMLYIFIGGKRRNA